MSVIDLTKETDQVNYLADKLFSLPYDSLGDNKFYLELENNTELYDIFFLCLEIVLFGINKLTNNALIFDLKQSNDDIIYVIKKYLNVIGLNIDISEIYCENINQERQDSNIYCELFSPPPFKMHENLIQGYRVRINHFHEEKKNLNQIKACFINSSGKLFLFNFDFKRQ